MKADVKQSLFEHVVVELLLSDAGKCTQLRGQHLANHGHSLDESRSSTQPHLPACRSLEQCHPLTGAQSYIRCFRVTFLFEQHLMELRKQCFDKSKQCAALSLCVTADKSRYRILHPTSKDYSFPSVLSGCHSSQVI
jgi:hypothetical protein